MIDEAEEARSRKQYSYLLVLYITTDGASHIENTIAKGPEDLSREDLERWAEDRKGDNKTSIVFLNIIRLKEARP